MDTHSPPDTSNGLDYFRGFKDLRQIAATYDGPLSKAPVLTLIAEWDGRHTDRSHLPDTPWVKVRRPLALAQETDVAEWVFYLPQILRLFVEGQDDLAIVEDCLAAAKRYEAMETPAPSPMTYSELQAALQEHDWLYREAAEFLRALPAEQAQNALGTVDQLRWMNAEDMLACSGANSIVVPGLSLRRRAPSGRWRHDIDIGEIFHRMAIRSDSPVTARWLTELSTTYYVDRHFRLEIETPEGRCHLTLFTWTTLAAALDPIVSGSASALPGSAALCFWEPGSRYSPQNDLDYRLYRQVITHDSGTDEFCLLIGERFAYVAEFEFD